MKKTLILLMTALLLFSFGGCATPEEKFAKQLDGQLNELKVGVEAQIERLSQAAMTEKSWAYFALNFLSGDRNAEYISGVTVGENLPSTTVAKVAITLSAMGEDAASLIARLKDHPNNRQLVNAASFTLLAYDSRAYAVTDGDDRETLIEIILGFQNEDGSFGPNGDEDTTAMALQALAPYYDGHRTEVDRALSFLSERQQSGGGFLAYEVENACSASQVLIALTALGIDPLSDARFIKDKNIYEYLISLKRGEYVLYTASDKESNLRKYAATEQSFLALAALKKFIEGGKGLYDFTANTVTMAVDCKTVWQNPTALAAARKKFGGSFDSVIPADGVILPSFSAEISEGDTVYSVLARELKKRKLTFTATASLTGRYISMLANLSEFDCGAASGWIYTVNGDKSSLSCDGYEVKSGDIILWRYSCDLGNDI